MKNRLMIPLVLVALYGCADNAPTEPMPRAPSLRPLLGAFPGSNGRIAFVSQVDGGIHTMNPDGSDPRPLTAPGAGPAWNAAGTKMVFYARVGEADPSEIFVINADGSDRTQLTFNSAQPGLAFPSWSPDGSRIVFQNDFDHKIYVMDSNGGNVSALTAGPDFAPTWSPDGASIAFSSTRDNGVSDIYVMNADGTNPRRLTINSVPDYDPSWSPDGSKIAFSHEGGNPTDFSEIYVMSADGTGATNLTNSPLRADVLASWSPDGMKIAFLGGDDAGADVYVMNAADGTSQTKITFTSSRESHLDWQPQPVAPVCVFGKTYTRMQGPPQRIVDSFTATPGSYSVDLDDLASSGADAVVTLNGVVIMEGRGTTGEVGPRHHTVPVTLLANNELEIQLRGKKGSKLQVTICPTSGSQCYPNLPAPALSLQSTTVDGNFVRFELDVSNQAQFPAAMFQPAPDLGACGLNTSAARTWVDIYDGNDNFLYGFCALYDGSLNDIWFATPVDQWPAEAYITLTDRRCNTTYTSNRINLAGILRIVPPPGLQQ